MIEIAWTKTTRINGRDVHSVFIFNKSRLV